MVDIHSHVLPGVDDGAATLEDSLAMLTMAADAGTTDIVATSHANTEYFWNANLIQQRLSEVQAAIGNRIRVHPGCELHLTFDNVNDAIQHPAKYTINHKHWLLIEFSDLIIFQNSGEILSRLRQAGMSPIIAHPERNQILQQRLDSLEKWVEDGAYLQLTAQSLLGTFGSAPRKFSERLIEKGMGHFVASDAHDTSYRVPKLDDAYRWLTDRYGEEYAHLVVFDNPAATLAGDDLPPRMPPKRKKWFGFFG
jgi:protein-tyrosine phosphatase